MFQFKRFAATGAVLGAVLGLAASVATAQTGGSAQAGVQSSGSSASSTPGQTITIFSKRNTRRPPNRTVIGTQSASSCGFMDTRNPADDRALQDYLTDFYGEDANEMQEQSTPNDPGTNSDDNGNDRSRSPASRTFRNNAPYGDASRDGDINGAMPNGAGSSNLTPDSATCGPSDQAFAAGRSYIAQHDHSLTDAYNAFDARDYPRALDLFKKSYDKMGYDVAALMEGKMYVAGLGTPRDMEKGIAWLKKATQAPFDPTRQAIRFNPDDPDYMNSRIDAAMTLAKIYVTGFHVPRSPGDAKHWYLKADEYGFVPASHIVGQIYENGYAGEQSLPKAVAYFRKAGIVGYAPSEYELGVIYYNGGDGVAEDRKAAADWLYHAAKRGNANALYALGRMYDLGDTLPADPQKAVVYYRDAALKGQPDAQNALGLLFYTGEIVGKDQVVARKWFLQAARGGNADAMFNLGVMMVNGEGGDKDLVLASVWFRLADEMGLEKGGAAARELEARLTPEDKARVDALLRPAPGQ